MKSSKNFNSLLNERNIGVMHVQRPSKLHAQFSHPGPKSSPVAACWMAMHTLCYGPDPMIGR